MTRQRAKLWLVAASLFTLVNLGGAGWPPWRVKCSMLLPTSGC